MSLTTTHWPNRPEQPFWWYQEWGPADGFAFLSDEPARRCCISSLQLSSQVDITYFEIRLEHGGVTESIAQILVPATSTVSITYPTPLVIESDKPWRLSYGPNVVRGLFHATVVGYDVHSESFDKAQSRRKPSL
jgi:hypothetical protein